MIDRLTADEDDYEEEESEGGEESQGSQIDDASDTDTDNVGDPSVEINVEELIGELESQGLTSRLDRDASTRKRLEELMERKRARRELEDFDDYDV